MNKQLIAAAAMAVLATGVSLNAAAQEVVRLGNLKFAHYGAVSYIKEIAPKCGIKVDEKVFPKGPDVMQGILAGELDVGTTASEAAISGEDALHHIRAFRKDFFVNLDAAFRGNFLDIGHRTVVGEFEVAETHHLLGCRVQRNSGCQNSHCSCRDELLVHLSLLSLCLRRQRNTPRG